MRALRLISVVFFVFLLLPVGVGAQEPVDWDVVSKIREEGLQRSQVMDIVGYMADVLGPRLTASPSMRAAQAWAQEKMAEIGLENIVYERAGEHGVNWDNEYTSVHMLAPDYAPLIAYAKAFTAGTDGKIEADAVIVHVQTEADLAQYRGKLSGKVVLLREAVPTEPEFEPDAQRLTEEDLAGIARTPVGEAGGGTVTLTMAQLNALREGAGQEVEPISEADLHAFLKEEGVALILDIGSGRGDEGTVYVGGSTWGAVTTAGQTGAMRVS